MNVLNGPFEQRRIALFGHELKALHQHVLRYQGRVELFDDAGGATVLVTKSELDALEAAIEMLGKTDAVRAMHIEVARVAAASMAAS